VASRDRDPGANASVRQGWCCTPEWKYVVFKSTTDAHPYGISIFLVVRGNGEPYEMSKDGRVGTCWSASEMTLFAATCTFSFGQTDTTAFTTSLLVVCGKANVVGSF
jgi:hypothetical protein